MGTRRQLRRPSEIAILAALLAAGVLLRLYATLEWRPAITGYSDSGIYIQAGVTGVFSDPVRTVGYSMFLIGLHWVSPHLLLVTVVQHLFGLATGLLLFLTMRRCGAPAGLGLVPAAIVLLGGAQVLLEHAVLSESLFALLVAGLLYAAVRTSNGSIGWAAPAGACAGLAVTVRGAGIVLVPVLVAWLVLCHGRPSQRTLAHGALALAVSAAIVGGYVGWRHAETGLSGLTTNGNWNLYGRAAPFADCSKFTPPAGTEDLCDPVAPGERVGRTSEWYIFSPESPAQRLLGPPYLVSKDPQAPDRLGDFARAAITGQPLDYLDAVWSDALRLIDSDRPSDGGLSADDLIAFMFRGPDRTSGRNDFVDYWQGRYYPGDTMHRGDTGALEKYEELTRITGPFMVFALVMAAAAPWLARGAPRRAAALFALVAFALLLFPVVSKNYDYRFVIPALGPLIAAAALGCWGLSRVSGPRARR